MIWKKAQITYTRLLQSASSSKVLRHARDGVQRVRDQLAQRRNTKFQEASSAAISEVPAILVLAPVLGVARRPPLQDCLSDAARPLYRAHADPPVKHWRMFRVGGCRRNSILLGTASESRHPRPLVDD